MPDSLQKQEHIVFKGSNGGLSKSMYEFVSLPSDELSVSMNLSSGW